MDKIASTAERRNGNDNYKRWRKSSGKCSSKKRLTALEKTGRTSTTVFVGDYDFPINNICGYITTFYNSSILMCWEKAYVA